MLRQLWILAALALRVTARLAHDEDSDPHGFVPIQ